MKNKLNREDFNIIQEIAISKTHRLNLLSNDIDVQGTKSYKALNEIITGDDALIYKRIISKHYQMSHEPLGSRQFYRNCNPYSLHNSVILWARMYVIAYFFYHNDSLWKEKIFADIKRFIISAEIRDEIADSEKRIDAYYHRLEEYQDVPNKSDDAVYVPQSDANISEDKVSAGRPLSNLFIDDAREGVEKERLISYIKSHKLYSQSLTSEKDNRLNKIIACFGWQWEDLHYTDKLTGTTLCRFLTEKCQMKLSVDSKSYANRMTEILQKKQFFEDITGEVSELFAKEFHT